jgi:hypothetical protein
MSNRTPTIATKMRYFAGSFWTPDTDTRLQRLEAQGLSAAKIAAKLGVSRNSVIARSQRLRGLSRTISLIRGALCYGGAETSQETRFGG